MALTDGVSTVDTLVAVLSANSIGMTTVYHWQLWEPAKPLIENVYEELGCHLFIACSAHRRQRGPCPSLKTPDTASRYSESNKESPCYL